MSATSPTPPRARRVDGWLAAVGLPIAFLLGAFVWLILCGVLMVGLIFGEAALLGTPINPNNPETSAFAAGAGTFLQLGGWAVVAAALALIAGAPMREAFATKRASIAMLVLAAVAGLSVGLFPGLIADLLRRVLPAWLQLDTLGQISGGLTEGPLHGRLAMLAAVVIAAPIFEELIFRGFLWDVFGRVLPPPAVLVLTSLMFAAIHIDPVQATAVLFTGLFIGWVRLMSDSIWPCMMVHASNNGLAALIAVTVVAEDQPETPLWAGAIGFLLTAVFAAVAFALRHDRPGAIPAPEET